MMARRGVLGVLAGASAAVLSGCGVLGRNSYRFRMTVEVDTPQGLKTGSGVYEVSASEQIVVTLEVRRGASVSARGEATVVDLRDGPLFVLLKYDDAGQPLHDRVTAALAPDAPIRNGADYVAAVGKLGGWFGRAKAELPRADWPVMVRFRDIDDPKSVEQVDPEAIGVRRIVVETTGDEVTTGIRGRLKWMGEFPESRLDRDYRGSTNPTIAQKLSNGDFRQGTY